MGKKGFKRKKGNGLSKKQEKGVSNIVHKVLKENTEYKQHQVSAPPTAVYTGVAGAHFAHLTNMAQGVLDTNRVGDEATIKWLQLRIQLYNGVGATANVNVNWRVILFQYNRPDGAPTLAELFLSAAANGGGGPGTWSARNIDYLNIYHVLVDRVYKTEQGFPAALNYGETGILTHNLVFKLPMKFVKKKIQYVAAGTAADNGIWLCVTTGQGTVATDPGILYTSACGYTDS